VDGLLVTDCDVCEFRGIHFENHGTLSRGYDIRLEAPRAITSNLLFANNRISQPNSTTGGVLVNGGTGTVFLQNRVMDGRFTVAPVATAPLLLWNNLGVATYNNKSTSTVKLDYGGPAAATWDSGGKIAFMSSNVGIGVREPTTKLQVDGPVRIKGYAVATVPS